MQENLLDYVQSKYPSRGAVRWIEEKESFFEIMFNGGDTLYLSKNYG